MAENEPSAANLKDDKLDSVKKSTRIRIPKFNYFDAMIDEDSPKKSAKKKKKDKLKEKLKEKSKADKLKKPTPNSEFGDVLKKKVKLQLNAEESKLIKRLKRTNKPTFNPKLFEESKLKRDTYAKQLKEIEEEFGKNLPKAVEPNRTQTHWDFLLKEMTQVAGFFAERRRFRIFKSRKIAFGAKAMVKNLHQAEHAKVKENEQRIKKIANELNRMVQREFWKNIHKIQKYLETHKQQQQHYKSQQKKLESFVTKQLKLSTKMAHYMKEKPKNEMEEEQNGDLEMEDDSARDSELSHSEDEYPPVKINIGLDKGGYYVLEEEEPLQNGDTLTDQKNTVAQISNLASEFQPKGFTLDASEVKIQQPFLMKGTLREYQLIGLNWLVMLHQKKINGILADEMGLGKTIQTIALLSYLACDLGIWGPHLIVVPTSILVNWEIEFKRWCPALKVMTYFGSPRERKAKRMGWSKTNFFHICITSYKLVIQDKKIFRRKRWYYMILDEAHNIKNFKSQRWQILLGFQTKRRLLLTGTPLQNDVSELWSLMHFLMPNIFSSHADFDQWFNIPMQQAIQKNQQINMNILQHLHSILRPFILRRLKKDVEKQLPSKTEYIIRCPLSRRQKYLYDEFISKNETKAKIQNQDFLGLMNVLMQLRKVCNHPNLFDARSVESATLLMPLKYVVPTLCALHSHAKATNRVSMVGLNLLQLEFQGLSTFDYERRIKLKPTDLNLATSLNQNVLEILKYQNHFTYKWRAIKLFERNKNIEHNFEWNSTRIELERSIYGSNLIRLCEKLTEDPEKREILREFKLAKSIQEIIFDYKDIIAEYMVIPELVLVGPVRLILSKFSHQNEMLQQQMQSSTRMLKPFVNEFHYLAIRKALIFPNKKMFVYDCGKLNKMMQLLKDLKREGHKALIFTQMSKMLDLFEGCLSLYNFTYVRLDGSTRPDMRQRLVERFNNDPKIFCFISSTRSGGIGLNLTGADTVVFYDTDWNPAMDKQAQDRCHRIGQTRNVSIFRLITESSIEENILLKNMQKRKLDEFIMEEGNFTTEFFQKIDVRDLLGEMLTSSKDQPEISYQQFENTLERIEDEDDIQATKNAFKEQDELIHEDLRPEFATQKNNFEFDENNPSINVDMLPPLYKYGLDVYSYRYESALPEDTDKELAMEEEKDEEQKGDNSDDESSSDRDFTNRLGSDSDDSRQNRVATLNKKEAMKLYKDSKRNIRKNYFLKF